MLYLIAYNFHQRRDGDSSPFFKTLDSLGVCRVLSDSAFLIDSDKSAVDLRREIIDFFGVRDTLFITKVFEGHAAGQLQSDSLKRFIATRWAFDPVSPPKFRGYYSF